MRRGKKQLVDSVAFRLRSRQRAYSVAQSFGYLTSTCLVPHYFCPTLASMSCGCIHAIEYSPVDPWLLVHVVTRYYSCSSRSSEFRIKNWIKTSRIAVVSYWRPGIAAYCYSLLVGDHKENQQGRQLADSGTQHYCYGNVLESIWDDCKTQYCPVPYANAVTASLLVGLSVIVHHQHHRGVKLAPGRGCSEMQDSIFNRSTGLSRLPCDARFASLVQEAKRLTEAYERTTTVCRSLTLLSTLYPRLIHAASRFAGVASAVCSAFRWVQADLTLRTCRIGKSPPSQTG